MLLWSDHQLRQLFQGFELEGYLSTVDVHGLRSRRAVQIGTVKAQNLIASTVLIGASQWEAVERCWGFDHRRPKGTERVIRGISDW